VMSTRHSLGTWRPSGRTCERLSRSSTSTCSSRRPSIATRWRWTRSSKVQTAQCTGIPRYLEFGKDGTTQAMDPCTPF